MKKRQEILQASRKLFAQFGLKKVTTDDIARKARVSKATVYHHYKNKYDIFREVVNYETDIMIKSMMASIEKSCGLEESLNALLNTKIACIHELINVYRVTNDTWNDHWPYIREVHEKLIHVETELVGKVLGNGSCDELDLYDLELQARLFVITLKSIEYPWALEAEGYSSEEIVRLVVKTFLDGVRKR